MSDFATSHVMTHSRLSDDDLTNKKLRDLILSQDDRAISRLNRPELRQVLADLECGILRYDHYDLAELQTFARALRLKYEELTLPVLCRRLYTRARKRKFRRFLDLPPEVRVMVYKYAFTSLIDPEGDRAVYVQPAVSKTSRVVRQESLPVWLSSRYFTLVCHRRRYLDDSVRQWLSSRTQLFFDSTNDLLLANIKHLRIECTATESRWPRSGNYRQTRFVISIDLTSSGDQVNDIRVVAPYRSGDPKTHRVRERFRETFASLLKQRHATTKGFGSKELSILAKSLSDPLGKPRVGTGLGSIWDEDI